MNKDGWQWRNVSFYGKLQLCRNTGRSLVNSSIFPTGMLIIGGLVIISLKTKI